MLHKIILVAFVVLTLETTTVRCQEDAGHFQVQNSKEGELKVHATKEIAQIETQASSVHVVLEPGIVKIPATRKLEEKETEKEDRKDGKIRKIIKIESPIFIESGLRRSRIGKKLKEATHHSQEKVHRALRQGKRTFENSVMLEHWKEKNREHINKNLKRVLKTNGVSKTKIKKFRRAEVPSRKSQIDREMKVRGKTGGLRLKTGKHGTKVVSSGGDLNIFIHNPDQAEKEDFDSNSDRRSPSSDSNYHVISANMAGLSLKKDSVPGVN